jgi:hypothetical protein
LLEPYSFVRVIAVAAIFAGLEYRYVNNREKGSSGAVADFKERPVFSTIYPYHLYFVLPLFVLASFALPLTAWAANVFLLATLEDALYFVWRRKWIQPGDWTTKMFGSFRVGGATIPTWYPLALAAAAALYAAPF